MNAADMPAVLYVDDESTNLRVFQANFGARFRVVTCSSGAEALERLSQVADVGVILSDQRMPGMTGVELLERVKVLVPDAQRMLVTAYSDMQAVMSAVNRGQVSRYFVKPWVKEDVQAALEEAVRIYSLQSRVREVENRLLQSERLAAIGQVSAGIAHELMNPVGYVTQNVEALRAELGGLGSYLKRVLQDQPSAEVSQTLLDLPGILEDIETGTKHIRQVALGLRNQVRGEDVEQMSNLAEVAGFAVKLARAEVRQRAKLVTDSKPTWVMGGPVKLCQVLLNLIVNAAHAMEKVDRKGLIQVRWQEGPERVRVQVMDNGCGIPPELHEKVFEPLFTTKAVGVGTGLGLAICRDLVRGMGGEISLESELDVGTTLTLDLPRAAPPAAP